MTRGRKTRTADELVVAYLSKVDTEPTEGGCYLWLKGKRSFGHGAFFAEGKQWPAHRWLYDQVLSVQHPDLFPPLKPGEVVRHDCDNPACQTPGHLRSGSAFDNMRDAAQRMRCASQTLDYRTVLKIKAARDSGMNYSALAELFGVSRTTAFRAVQGKGVQAQMAFEIAAEKTDSRLGTIPQGT